MGEETRQSAQTRRGFTGLLTAAALSPLLAPAVARAQMVVRQVSPAAPSALIDNTVIVKAAEDRSARMTVPVMLNGQGPFLFVVDTGSNRTVVSDTLAAQLQLPAGDILQVSSALGVDATPSALIAQLAIGKHQVSNIVAPVLVQGNLGAVGMLGIDALADQTIVMDFKAGTMRIQPSSRKEEDQATVIVRAKSKYGQLILVDAWVEGIQLYVIIDTGGEVTIGNLTLRDALLRRRAHTPTPVKVTSVTGSAMEADLSVLPRVLLGHIEVGNLQIAYADMHVFDRFGLKGKPAVLLGMSTLRHFDRVWVDFKARQVRFQFDDQARMIERPAFARGLTPNARG
jgi:predicted aspartyl protease